jgi:dimeric dUTPase (all-alpha-NTP-PPase superfamily)
VAEWTPFQTHRYSENLVALGIEPGTTKTVARNFDYWTSEAVWDLTNTSEMYRPLKQFFFYFKSS